MNAGPTLTLQYGEWEQVKLLADRRMKANNGHQFETILKTRCVHCRRSPRAKGTCRGWFLTFVSHVDTILLNLDREREAGELK
jgi:hypothetical protein